MFGEFLIRKEICTRKQVSTALEVSHYRKDKLGRLLLELGYISTKRLDSALVQYLKPETKMTFGELQEMKNQIPLEDSKNGIFRDRNLVPIAITDDLITVAGTTFSDSSLHALEEQLGLDVRFLRVKDTVYRLLVGDSEENDREKTDIVVSGDLSPDQKAIETNPYTLLIRECLAEASKVRASDVHFEPFQDQYLIRFRVHGVLQDWKRLQSSHTEPITHKLKWILGLDLAVASKPQDSRATFESLAVDVRVNSMPTASGGEKIVLRMQYQEEKLSLSQIGLSDEKIAVLRRNIQKREGLIIISGPTGSGKTTTLYALLEEMDRMGKNISTLENPVEKSLERIVQSNVSSKEDFNDFQRALMRQDPDVILLGEIRDPETADLSMKLSSTGHLVLSTVHANGAREVVDRLLNLGVDKFSIETNLRLSVAQRLVRRLCTNCRIKKTDGFTVNTQGCSHCSKGISGRIAIIEYLERSDLDVSKPPTSLFLECKDLSDQGVIDVNELHSFT